MSSTGRRIPKPLRLGLWILGAGLLVVATAGAVLSATLSPGYMYRWAFWQNADVGDWARFPARPIAAAAEPFTFDAPADPAAATESVLAGLRSSPRVGGDPETFLEETGTQAFIVIRDDTVLYERYFGDFRRDSVATSFSVAKSYVSALFGIAIEEGLFGVDDPVTDHVPELLDRDPRFADITIGHLLDMTSGLRYQETGLPWGDDALTYYFDDLRALAVARTGIVDPPGVRWHYVNYNPLLLGMVLERATGETVSGYLESRIWTRIGTEFPASWSLDHEDGFEKMESGLNARPIDFAKLGRLYLDGGRWEGEPIVPEAWVAASTDPRQDDTSPSYPAYMTQPYGTVTHERYWWRITRPDGSYAFSALGNHGQFVFVVPDARLVIVRNGERYGIRSFDWFGVFLDLADFLAASDPE